MKVWLCLVLISVVSACWQAHDLRTVGDSGPDADDDCVIIQPDGLSCWSPIRCEEVYYCGTSDCCALDDYCPDGMEWCCPEGAGYLDVPTCCCEVRR